MHENKMQWTIRQLADEARQRGRPVSHQHIRNLIRSGELAGERIGRDYVIFGQSARQWLEQWLREVLHYE